MQHICPRDRAHRPVGILGLLGHGDAFGQRPAYDSPVDNMNWMVAGCSISRHDYYGDVYEFTMAMHDDVTITKARHLLRRICDTRHSRACRARRRGRLPGVDPRMFSRPAR